MIMLISFSFESFMWHTRVKFSPSWLTFPPKHITQPPLHLMWPWTGFWPIKHMWRSFVQLAGRPIKIPQGLLSNLFIPPPESWLSISEYRCRIWNLHQSRFMEQCSINRLPPVSLPYRNGGNAIAFQYLYVCLTVNKNI